MLAVANSKKKDTSMSAFVPSRKGETYRGSPTRL